MPYGQQLLYFFPNQARLGRVLLNLSQKLTHIPHLVVEKTGDRPARLRSVMRVGSISLGFCFPLRLRDGNKVFFGGGGKSRDCG